jgi:TetR/AcrR family transcriptional repressor of mexJK operon
MPNPPEASARATERVTRPSRTAPAARRAAGRPTRDAAADLHHHLLDRALEEFLTHGFGAASIEGIARAAGVHKDTIYRQFGTKEALYHECVRRALETMARPLRASVAAPHDVAQTLAGVMRQIHRTFTAPRTQKFTSMTVTQAALFPDLAEAARADSRAYLEPLADYLRQLQRDGTLQFDDPLEAAELLAIAALGGVRFLYEPTLQGAELDAFVERRLALFLRGWNFRPRPATRRTRS